MSVLKRRRQDCLQRKQNILDASQQRIFQEKEYLTAKMIYYGLWQSENDMEDKIREIGINKEKLIAIKTQINFRKIVLEQPVSDKSLFSFSSKADVIFSFETLKDN